MLLYFDTWDEDITMTGYDGGLDIVSRRSNLPNVMPKHRLDAYASQPLETNVR